MTSKHTLKERVLRTFLKDPKLGPSEMTKVLEVKYNSVKAVYVKLCDEGFLRREGRGTYVPDITSILLRMMDKVEALEKNLE
jgi:DNA-binding transcriptional regulator YhcF (GntR family)